MKTRIKQTLPLISTRDDAEAVMHDLVLVINNQRATIAKRDGEVLAINKRYEGNLSAYDQAIREKTDTLRAWAEANSDQFPKGRKSIDFVTGILGFRTGTPKLALMSRAFTWNKVLSLLKAISPWRNYVRTKEEVDKESLLAAHSALANTVDQPVFDTDLKSFGLKVVQDETFYIEPKLTDLETRQTSEAA